MNDNPVADDNDVFRALADPSRRQLLDQLREDDGQSLASLCDSADMSRQAVSKHLRILENANLITTRMAGRQKLHFLNAVPIQQIAQRWLSRFSQHQASELIRLKSELEETGGHKP